MSQLGHEQARPVTQPKGCASWFIREGRLRSGWRVTLYLNASRFVDLTIGVAIVMVGLFMIALPAEQNGSIEIDLSGLIETASQSLFVNPAVLFVYEAARFALILPIVWLFRRLVDRKSFRSLGFEMPAGWWRELFGGFWLVVAAWGVIFSLSLAFGAATIIGFTWDTGGWVPVVQSLVLGLVLNLLVGIVEEADARGYVLQNLAEGIRFWPAVLVSSAYFGLLHLLNPGAGLASTAGIVFAGVLLALGYYATGRLWFSIGMHAAWNFAEGPLFGFLVSGIPMGGLFHLRVVGPDWLMGGSFGPEAGALAVAVEIVLTVILYLWARSRPKELVHA